MSFEDAIGLAENLIDLMIDEGAEIDDRDELSLEVASWLTEQDMTAQFAGEDIGFVLGMWDER